MVAPILNPSTENVRGSCRHTCIKGVEFQKGNLRTENCFEADILLNSFHQYFSVEFNMLGKLLWCMQNTFKGQDSLRYTLITMLIINSKYADLRGRLVWDTCSHFSQYCFLKKTTSFNSAHSKGYQLLGNNWSNMRHWHCESNSQTLSNYQISTILCDLKHFTELRKYPYEFKKIFFDLSWGYGIDNLMWRFLWSFQQKWRVW